MSDYQVFARKYRPKTFAQIVGQEPLVKILVHSLQQEKVGHAYLFSGPHGTGKTSLARILAKALNCNNLQGYEPCNECASCKEVQSGSSLDVLEIDGASHRGIEDIRQINETLSYLPSQGKYRIFLIDEVHMLTKEAFNALLKSLEEPPRHAKFFLATTEAHLVPTTIVSRCQRLNFKRIPLEKMVEKLQRIAQELNRLIDPPAITLLAHYAEGGLRDAESYFEELLLYQEGSIHVHHVQELLGLAPQELFQTLDQAVIQADFNQVFLLVEQLLKEGKNLVFFLEQLTQHFRTHLLQQMQKASPLPYTLPECLEVLELLSSAPQEMQKAPSKRAFLELLLLKIVKNHRTISLEQLVERLENLEKKLQKQEDTPPLPSPTPSRAQPQAESMPEEVIGVQEKARQETILRFAAKELKGSLES